MNQIKIYDIAGSAGVSLATVSRVLNHPEKVKKATRDKVLRIIKEKGYKPNANARGLASRKSTTVAVIVPTLTRASIAESIQGIDDSAKKYGYSIRLFVNNNKEEEKELWGDVIASSVDGILFMNDEMSEEVLELSNASPVPVVFVNANANSKQYCSVSIDNEECAYNITKQMIEKGNKKIVFITTSHFFSINELKVKGYKRAMEEAKLPYEVIDSTGKLDQNEVQYREYLEHNHPEVVLAVRDSMAISFMNVASKMGINVPDDLQVICFQNTRYSLLSNPQLTCVETPIYEIGNIAMSMLTEEMQAEEEVRKETRIVDYRIIWRGSTK